MQEAEGVTVYVLIYTHSNGVDVWVNSTEEQALLRACDVILRWWDDLRKDPEAQAKIREHMARGEYMEALAEWHSAQETFLGETLAIEGHVLDNIDGPITHEALGAALAALD